MCTKGIPMRHSCGFLKRGTGMSAKPTKWSDYQVSSINATSLSSMLWFALLTMLKLFQLVDCLQWRIDSEIDNILAVSFFFIRKLLGKHISCDQLCVTQMFVSLIFSWIFVFRMFQTEINFYKSWWVKSERFLRAHMFC